MTTEQPASPAPAPAAAPAAPSFQDHPARATTGRHLAARPDLVEVAGRRSEVAVEDRAVSSAGGAGPAIMPRRKICTFGVDKVKHIDYKDVGRLRRFISDRHKMEARRKTGVCSKHQRALSRAIKRARVLALIPFSPDHRMPGGGYAA